MVRPEPLTGWPYPAYCAGSAVIRVAHHDTQRASAGRLRRRVQLADDVTAAVGLHRRDLSRRPDRDWVCEYDLDPAGD